MPAHPPPLRGQPVDGSVAADLPCDLSSAGRARRLVLDHCRRAGVGADALDALELLVSEVVTNAVLHGRSTVHLAVRVPSPSPGHPRVVRLEVADDNSRVPEAKQTDADALDGRGLAILDVLARAWGVEVAPVGKVVWVEVEDGPSG